MSSALGGIRVLEITSTVSGAWCGRMLAGFGADVVRVDRARVPDQLRETAFDDAGVSRGVWHRHTCAGKRSVLIDMHAAAGRGRLARLVAAADIIITDLPSQEREQLGLDFEQLHQAHPRTVVVQVAAVRSEQFSGTVDPVLMAMSGWMSVQGASDDAPVAAGGDFVSYLTGNAAAVGALAALMVVEQGGPGQRVDIAAVDVAMASTMFDVSGFASTGRLRPRRTNEPGQSWSVFQAVDGSVSVNSSAAREWVELWSIVFAGEVPAAQLAMDGLPLDSEGIAVLERLVASTSKRELMETAQLLGHLVGEVLTLGEVLDSPQLNARDWFVDDHGLRAAGAPVRLESTPWRHGGPAPRRGQHDEEVDREWVPRDAVVPSAGHLPLHGIRVVDLSAGWAGPFAAQLLADLGADVIKVESVGRTDWVRTARRFFTGPDDPIEQLWEHSPMFNGVNEAKRGITLDLTDPECHALLLRLVEGADVLIENFTPRVMVNLGLTDEVLAAAAPNLIVMSMPGMGREGPWRDFRATALVTEAVAGVTSRCGYPDGPPQVIAMQHADPNAAFVGAFAAVLALRRKISTGQGQRIEVAQVEALVTHVGAELLATQLLGTDPPRRGSRMPGAAPSGCFRTAGEDEWLVLAIRDDREWEDFTRLLQAPTVWPTAAERADDVDAVEEWVSQRLNSRDGTILAERLRARGIAAAMVNNAADIVDDPELAVFFHTLERVPSGAHPSPDAPFRLSGTPLARRTPAPRLGQHNIEVLRGELGTTADDFEALVRRQVVGCAPRSQ